MCEILLCVLLADWLVLMSEALGRFRNETWQWICVSDSKDLKGHLWEANMIISLGI